MGSANSNIVEVSLPNTSARDSVQAGADFLAGSIGAFLPPVGAAVEDIQSGADFLGGAFTGVDPDFAEVVLLLHMDGVNGSTSFPDSSSIANVMTSSGSTPPSVSTASPMFGTGAANFGTTLDSADHITCPITTNGPLDLNSDFTIEGWVKFINFNGKGMLGDSAAFSKWLLLQIGGGALTFQLFDSSHTGFPVIANAPASVPISLGIWYAFAVVRLGSILTLYVNGIAGIASRAVVLPLPPTTGTLSIGGFPSVTSLAGQIDEVRITNGVARYTANYTPSGPFPNS